MITNSPRVFSHMTTEDMRRSAKNLRLLAGEDNAIAATELDDQADAIDGIWRLFPDERRRAA